MHTYKKLAALASLSLALGVAGCHGDFLTGGELSTDPNRPVVATKSQLFQGIEANIWAFLGSDPARVTGIFAQQFTGGISQYQTLNDTYAIDANTTNGFHAALYGGGGLVDIKKLEAASKASNDQWFLGIAQVQEGLLMGTGADMFGDLVYSQAIQTPPIQNPKLDKQLAVYDSVQKVLSAAITNLSAASSATNVGPGGNDLVYGGDPIAWRTLAHTLKARFYMHTAEVDPTAYAKALAEAQQGIKSDAGDYVGPFTAAAAEQNFYYQLNVTAGRGGYLLPNQGFFDLLKSRNDPRATEYFATDSTGTVAVQLSDTRLAPDFHQPFVTYDENTLIWAEAAWRTGDYTTARAKLNEERANHGLPADTASTNQSLLNEILIEKYIADFQLGLEAWNDYKRTCTPNLVPAPDAAGGPTGGKIPARFFYDTSELSTDTNYPAAGTGVNGYRNQNDPANATSDGTGAKCLGQ